MLSSMASSITCTFVSLLFTISGGLTHKTFAEVDLEALQDTGEMFPAHSGRVQLTRKRETNCPPPIGSGMLQVQSSSDLINLQGSNNALVNLAFMCGTALITEKIPVQWVLIEAENGSVVNQTEYEERPRIIPLCCPGYVRNADDICVPKCKGNCLNGVCVSPGNCACYLGYALNSLGECVVTCPCGCPNGRCTGDKCFCDEGYALDGINKVCNPVCMMGCENADCISPNNCTCHRGYEKNNMGDHICVPHCTNGCHHGRCTAPDICTCDEGFYKSKKTGKCLPICIGCKHGVCVEPYVCKCHRGYTRQNEDCEPVCERKCINSTCTAPNYCSCFDGYKRSTPLTCAPACVPGCSNAQCVAPNQCECNDGYVKDKKAPPNICIHISLQVAAAAANLISQLRH